MSHKRLMCVNLVYGLTLVSTTVVKNGLSIVISFVIFLIALIIDIKSKSALVYNIGSLWFYDRGGRLRTPVNMRTKFQHLKKSIVNCLLYLIFQAYFRLPKRFNTSKRNALTELKSIWSMNLSTASWRRLEELRMLLLLGQQIIYSFCFAWRINCFKSSSWNRTLKFPHACVHNVLAQKINGAGFYAGCSDIYVR